MSQTISQPINIAGVVLSIGTCADGTYTLAYTIARTITIGAPTPPPSSTKLSYEYIGAMQPADGGSSKTSYEYTGAIQKQVTIEPS